MATTITKTPESKFTKHMNLQNLSGSGEDDLVVAGFSDAGLIYLSGSTVRFGAPSHTVGSATARGAGANTLVSASYFVGNGSSLTGISTDVDGLTAFSGVPHATADQFIVSDDGTEKRATMTMVANGAFALVSGAGAIAAGGALTIANDAIDSQHYAAASIDNEHLADDAVDSAEIASGAVDNDHMAADSVDSANYVDASIDFEHIQNVAANSILGRNANSSGVLSEVALATTQLLIGDGTGFTAAALSGDVTMTNAGAVSIGADKITAAMIGDNVLDSEHYAAASIDNEHLADDAVDSDEIAAGAIDNAHMAANSVDSDQYVNGSVDNVHLANSAVTVGSTSISLGATSTTLAGLTSLDCTAANQAVYATAGANTITLGGAASTVKCANDLTVTGDLIVNGTTTSINSVQLNVEDKQIRLGIPGGMVDATYTISSNVVTVASTSHGITVGQFVYISDPAATAVITEGVYVLTAAATHTFTFAFTASDQGSATAIQHGKDDVTAATGDGVGIFVAGVASTTATGIEWDSTKGWQILGGDLDIDSGNSLSIAGTNVVSATSLGSGVVGSSLTSLGTIATGVWEGTDVGVAHGGTGASTAGAARTALGVAIGSDVQAYDAQLADVAGLAVTNSGFIVGDGSNFVLETGATLRTSMGVGTGDSPQFTGIEVGHANDTTLSRSSAGVLQVQTDAIIMAGATQTMTNKTLTAPDINAGTVENITSLITGTDGSGVDVTFYAGAANESMSWVSADNQLEFINSSDGTILTISGDATGEYAVDVTSGADAINKIRASAFVTHSKRSLKSNIAPMKTSAALSDVMKMQGVTYKLRDSIAKPGLPDRKQEVGFIAEDMQNVVPQVVTVDPSGAAQGIDYAKLTAVLTEAIKEQQKQIEELKSKVNNLA